MGLLGPDELRGIGMDQLKQRMRMHMLLQDPVEEGYADPTARDDYSNMPSSKIKKYVPGARDPGMARNRDMSPRRFGDMGDLAPSLISTWLESLKGR